MKERIWMIVLLLIIASISSGALGIMNIKTRPLIEKNRVLKLKEAVLNAFHIPYQHKNMEEVFEEEVKSRFLEDIPFYLHYTDKGRLDAIAFKIEGSGFWAPISAIIALKPDLETIYGMTILEQEETPGLGARIAEPGFLNRFAGKKIKPEIILVSRRKAKGDNEVDAITGATMTSKALEEIINDEVKKYRDAIIASKIIGEITHGS
jgi:Na+-transporting NADH:ubiquinone oxidoreductase subunit C